MKGNRRIYGRDWDRQLLKIVGASEGIESDVSVVTEKAFSLISGSKRLNLHALYLEPREMLKYAEASFDYTTRLAMLEAIILKRLGGVLMKHSNKFAWTWEVKEECLNEYVKMHLGPWDEIMEEHTKAGIYNYSIFQNNNQFFYCFECNDVKNAINYMANSEVCKRWNAITSKMVKGSFNFNE